MPVERLEEVESKPKVADLRFKDTEAKSEVEAAFRAMYAMPTNEEGEPQFTDAEFVQHHIKNYLNGVVREYRHRLAVEAMSLGTPDNVE